MDCEPIRETHSQIWVKGARYTLQCAFWHKNDGNQFRVCDWEGMFSVIPHELCPATTPEPI